MNHEKGDWPIIGRPLSFFRDRVASGERIKGALSSRSLESFRRDPQLAVVVFVGIIIAYLSLSPTLMLFYGSFLSKPLGVPGKFTLAHYESAYADPLTYQLLWNSFIFAAGSSILSTVLAATLAWIAIRTNAPFRKAFELTAIIPNIFPPDARRRLDRIAESANRFDQPIFDAASRSRKRAAKYLFTVGHDICRGAHHDAAGVLDRFRVALLDGPIPRRIGQSGRFEQSADRAAHYLSNRATRFAGSRDVEFCPRH